MITNRLHVQPPPKHPTAANGHEQGWVHKNGDGTRMNTRTREDWAVGGLIRIQMCVELQVCFLNFNFYSTNNYLHIAHTERAPSPLATSAAPPAASGPEHHHIATMTATGPPLTSTVMSTGPETFLGPCFSVFLFLFFYHQSTTGPLQAQGPRHVSGPFFFLFLPPPVVHHNCEYRPKTCLRFSFLFFYNSTNLFINRLSTYTASPSDSSLSTAATWPKTPTAWGHITWQGPGRKKGEMRTADEGHRILHRIFNILLLFPFLDLLELLLTFFRSFTLTDYDLT